MIAVFCGCGICFVGVYERFIYKRIRPQSMRVSQSGYFTCFVVLEVCGPSFVLGLLYILKTWEDLERRSGKRVFCEAAIPSLFCELRRDEMDANVFGWGFDLASTKGSAILNHAAPWWILIVCKVLSGALVCITDITGWNNLLPTYNLWRPLMRILQKIRFREVV